MRILRIFLTAVSLILTGTAGHAASVVVDDSAAVANSGTAAAGSLGAVVLDPPGVLGWANYGSASLTPGAGQSGGAIALTASQIGAFTLSASTDTRFSQTWTGGADTAGVRGQTATGMAAGEGFRISFTPGSTGDFTLLVHIADFNVDVAYAVRQGGNAVAAGSLGAFDPPNTYDEGPVAFRFTVATPAEAAATWEFDITRAATGGGNALVIGGVSLFPASLPVAPVLVIDSPVALVNDGTAQAYQLPFHNAGTSGNLLISAVTPGGADAADFHIQAVTASVAPGGSGAIDFTFAPSGGIRAYPSTFTIVSNDPVSPSVQVSVTVDVRPASGFSPGKLLCIGDSISEGRATRPDGEGNWSWRYWFWQNLVDYSIRHEFTGTRSANKDGTSSYPAYRGEVFVNRHEAIWGTTFLERSSSAPGFLGTLNSTGKTPDTAVIFGGGNDVPLDLSVSAATVRDRTKIIIDHLQGDLGTAGNPDIRILLVSILPRYTGAALTTPDVRNPRYQEINGLLSTLATAETTSRSEVSFLDLWDLFASPPGLLYDGTHPNGAGEQLCGNAIFAALVPGLPPVEMRFAPDAAPGVVSFHVRTRGPRRVRIESSPDLTPGSWVESVPFTLNPGEWSPMTVTGPSPARRQFYRAVTE